MTHKHTFREFTHMEIREKLINLRAEKRLSQQEFADMLDVSRTTVARWESGRNMPSSAQIANICRVFRIPYSELVDQPAADAAPAPTAVEGAKAGKRTFWGAVAALTALAVLAVAGLAVTVAYAVKDAQYDAAATVWIIAIPRNTPMIVLSAVLAVFIALLGVLIFLLVRRRRR